MCFLFSAERFVCPEEMNPNSMEAICCGGNCDSGDYCCGYEFYCTTNENDEERFHCSEGTSVCKNLFCFVLTKTTVCVGGG